MDTTLVSVKRAASDFLEIPVDLLRRGTTIDFDLLVRGRGRMVLYRNRHLAFSQDVISRLEQNGVASLWVRKSDERALGQYFESQLDEILSDPTLSRERKSEAIYTTARSLARDIFELPSKEKLQRTRPLVAKTVSALTDDPDLLSSLLRQLATRYEVHSHSVNVSAYTIGFAQQLGNGDIESITELALGGLLHDLGKVRVPREIVEKPGPLDDEEWEVMRRHPTWGTEMLGSLRSSMDVAADVILTHHERMDGSGYPGALDGDAIPLAGRIAAIADTFDALTTTRTYRSAFTPYEALVMMRDDLSGKFDLDLLKQFIVIWGPGGLIEAL